MKHIFISLLVSVFLLNGRAQIINGYAKVTAVSGSTFTLSTVDETADSFEDGEWVVLMQVQDDVIGTTSNTVDFGDLDVINSAGLFEIRQIASHTESAGTPTSITLVTPPTNTYNTCSNCSVQVITYPELGTPNYTTTSDLSLLPWDGEIGGVVALHVEGTLTLAHNILADSNGFRGGSRSVDFGGPTCDPANMDYYREDNNQLGSKGEGIYKNTSSTYNNGRAKILNGGGGGSYHNGGGAGGGNFTQGGMGGMGYDSCAAYPTGGFGGIELNTVITGNRVFLGGGGGGGQQNNTQSRDGANGGGVVLIHANEITTGTCGGLTISANGGSPLTDGGNDGGGGGGAAGSIVFTVNIWSVSASCPLTISANGGNGSTSLNGSVHAGGGAGAQGTIIFNAAQPTSNVTVETLNGEPGCNNNSSPCNSIAGSASGTDNSGIYTNTLNPLPIELIYFSAILNGNTVALSWQTKSERNNDYFTIERSKNALDWKAIHKTPGAGNSSSVLSYECTDENPLGGISYYRLKQTDFDGSFAYSSIQSVNHAVETTVFPNPADETLHLYLKPNTTAQLTLTNLYGQLVKVENIFTESDAIYSLPIENLAAGSYILMIEMNNNTSFHQVIISH